MLVRIKPTTLTLPLIEQRWKDCTKCKIGRDCKNHVFLGFPSIKTERADIVIIGEGPGKIEDDSGEAFRGPAGKVLRSALEDANPKCLFCDGEGVWTGIGEEDVVTDTCIRCDGWGQVRVVLTNLIACRPYARTPMGTGNREPAYSEVMNCMPRLIDTLRVLNPALIVAAGQEPTGYLPEIRKRLDNVGLSVMIAHIKHPSFILRSLGRKIDAGYQIGSNVYENYVNDIRGLYRTFWELKAKGFYNGNG